jgi:hypothetical protein
MKESFAFSTIAVATLAGSAFLMAPEHVAAKDYEFCRQNYSSGMSTCGFENMDQCVATISGRGGSCTRNPVLAEASASYAHVPKRRRPRRR